MIAVRGVSKFLGKKELFSNVSFHIQPGEKIGLIGVNGTGKTTLFHILLGEMEPDTGSVAKSKGLRLGYLPQHWTPLKGKSVLMHAMDTAREVNAVRLEMESLQTSLAVEIDPERSSRMAMRYDHLLERLEHLGGYDLEARACKILSGLGFKETDLIRQVETLSGGWIMRLELARLLLSEPDLLLLDEPTNHLDLDSLLWLEEYLLTTASAIMLVSHDRAFINTLVGRIMELHQGSLHEYTGNYDAYLEEKERRTQILEASFRNQHDRIKQMERFIDRNRCRKDRARQVQSRLKFLEKIERIEIAHGEAHVAFAFPDPPRSGRRVLELRGAGKSFGEQSVYSGIDLLVERGDRIAFLGPNGAGKSTLLKILAGVEPLTAGEKLVGHQVSIGYYAQHQWEQLKDDWTVLDEASSVAGDLSQSNLRNLLGSFLFRGDDVLKKVSVLSGGEKARLILCKLLLQRPNVLLLDEPTNHLDIPSRDVLERALEAFAGTICFISHDRHFIDRIAEKVLVIHGGTIHLFPGNYQDYQSIWKKRLEIPSPLVESLEGDGSVPEGRDAPARKGAGQKRLEAEWRNEFYRLKKPLQDSITRLETLVENVQDQLHSLAIRLADPATYQDGNLAQELQREYQRCQERIQQLTGEWEQASLALEELELDYWKDKNPLRGAGNADSLQGGQARAGTGS
ncbi:MAG: ABC-F family ATP-binding cassette domain-containing protein [Deltaproteobacteria bacterium]|nr:ABC-F family ATP-binding cassette domain-containing protein [Deltaproteobacteria bacterium]